uniref:Uncharacterized protein n=1 Tax=viral metagenome TaxID=1070528 RepID=A0A6C0IZS1_9ZZZZ
MSPKHIYSHEDAKKLRRLGKSGALILRVERLSDPQPHWRQETAESDRTRNR